MRSKNSSAIRHLGNQRGPGTRENGQGERVGRSQSWQDLRGLPGSRRSGKGSRRELTKTLPRAQDRSGKGEPLRSLPRLYLVLRTIRRRCSGPFGEGERSGAYRDSTSCSGPSVRATKTSRESLTYLLTGPKNMHVRAFPLPAPSHLQRAGWAIVLGNSWTGLSNQSTVPCPPEQCPRKRSTGLKQGPSNSQPFPSSRSGIQVVGQLVSNQKDRCVLSQPWY